MVHRREDPVGLFDLHERGRVPDPLVAVDVLVPEDRVGVEHDEADVAPGEGVVGVVHHPLLRDVRVLDRHRALVPLVAQTAGVDAQQAPAVVVVAHHGEEGDRELGVGLLELRLPLRVADAVDARVVDVVAEEHGEVAAVGVAEGLHHRRDGALRFVPLAGVAEDEEADRLRWRRPHVHAEIGGAEVRRSQVRTVHRAVGGGIAGHRGTVVPAAAERQQGGRHSQHTSHGGREPPPRRPRRRRLHHRTHHAGSLARARGQIIRKPIHAIGLGSIARPSVISRPPWPCA